MTDVSNEVHPNHEPDARRREYAASQLQQHYRSYKSDRESWGMNISSSARWRDALLRQQLKASAQDADAGQNAPAARWHRAGFYARRLIDDPPDEPAAGWEDKPGETIHKNMEARYWLEMIDRKHRKASNLNKYHEFWNTNYDGDQNFFYWLDEGDGKDIDLKDVCPREKLDSECVIYLTAEQRLNYLVKVADDGKLVWARNGRHLDTRRGKHKDCGDGRGIVDLDSDGNSTTSSSLSAPSSSSPSTSSSPRIRDDDYPVSDDDGSGVIDLGVGPQVLTPGNIWARMKAALRPAKPRRPAPLRQRKQRKKAREIAAGLRKPKGPKTWMFVVDANANLYVGIKQAGRFQHSSFLFGARVMAAGLIKVKDGLLTSLIPLSGHYKAGTPHFKHFVDLLHEAGCDMSHVSTSKGLITIGAVENYGKLTKARHDAGSRVKALVFPSHPDPEDEEKARERDREEARRKGEVAKRMWDKTPLPHEGVRKEDMTDEQRVERGAALVARAMARGLRMAQPDTQPRSEGGQHKVEEAVDHPRVKKSSVSSDADGAASNKQDIADGDFANMQSVSATTDGDTAAAGQGEECRARARTSSQA